jgi:hypothetical protein
MHALTGIGAMAAPDDCNEGQKFFGRGNKIDIIRLRGGYFCGMFTITSIIKHRDDLGKRCRRFPLDLTAVLDWERRRFTLKGE